MMKVLLVLCLMTLAVCATTQTSQKKMSMVMQSVKALEAKQGVHKPVASALKLLKLSFKKQDAEGIAEAKTKMQEYYSGCTQVGGNLCGGRPQLRDINRLVELLASLLDMDQTTTRESSSSHYPWEWDTSEKRSSSERWSEVRSENSHSRSRGSHSKSGRGSNSHSKSESRKSPERTPSRRPPPRPMPKEDTPEDCYYYGAVYCVTLKKCIHTCADCPKLAVADKHGICVDYCPFTQYACANTGRCVDNCQEECDDHSRGDWYEMRCIPLDTAQLKTCNGYGAYKCYDEGLEHAQCVSNCEYCGYTNGLDAHTGTCTFKPNPGACYMHMHQHYCDSTHECVQDCHKCPGLNYMTSEYQSCGLPTPETCEQHGKIACPMHGYKYYSFTCVDDCHDCEGSPIEGYDYDHHKKCQACSSAYGKFLCPHDNSCKSSCQNCVGHRHEYHDYISYEYKCAGCKKSGGFYCPVKGEYVESCCKDCGKGYVKENEEACSCDAGWDVIERLTKRVVDEHITSPVDGLNGGDLVYSDYSHFIDWVETVIKADGPDALPRCDVTVLPWKNPGPDNWLSQSAVNNWGASTMKLVLLNHFVKGRYTFEELAQAEEVETFATEFEDHPQTFRIVHEYDGFYMATPNSKAYVTSDEDRDDRFYGYGTLQTEPWGGHDCFADGNGIIHGTAYAVPPEYCWQPSAERERNWDWDHPAQPPVVCKVMEEPCDPSAFVSGSTPQTPRPAWSCPVGYCAIADSPVNSNDDWAECHICGEAAPYRCPSGASKNGATCMASCEGCGGPSDKFVANSLTGRCETVEREANCGHRHWCDQLAKCVDDCFFECKSSLVDKDTGECFDPNAV